MIPVLNAREDAPFAFLPSEKAPSHIRVSMIQIKTNTSQTVRLVMGRVGMGVAITSLENILSAPATVILKN